MAITVYRSLLDTRFGAMQLAVDSGGKLVELLLPNKTPRGESGNFPSEARAGMDAAKAQLEEYFAGKRRDFDLELDPQGSDFDRAVWRKLVAIPYGTTTSYGAIAGDLGLVNGARAVGRSNGSNPIAIVIPCHRVIGMDGTLTGYGGGLPLKRALLEMEGALPPEPPRLF